MPFGSIPSSQRLGLANTQAPNASSFASTVLRLAPNIPIYQQQIVHSTAWADGPAIAAGEWCGSVDSEYNHTMTIRQVSAHDTQFARRNVSVTPQYAFAWHHTHYFNQLYYINNEPEAGSSISIKGFEGSCNVDLNCWDPRDRNLDPAFTGCFPNPNTQFWETTPPSMSLGVNCASGADWKRIRPEAMAYVYLRLKREAEGLPRGHVVLPPSAISASLGAGNPYWQTFYDKVHGGVSIGSCSEARITPASLKALHVHQYSLDPAQHPQTLPTPLHSVAWAATEIRRGADWYRNRYNGGAAIPADILLSEMGPAWNLQGDKRWAGGWSNFRTGLSWWNSWLCWVTRRGPLDCNLQGWDTGAHTIHACIHQAAQNPYATTMAPNSNRNQWYFNTDTWNTHVYYDAPSITLPGLALDGRYQNSFTAFDSIPYGGQTWRTTPFGACFTVWSRVGADPITSSLNTGWVSNTQAGVIGTASVQLPAGYSTIYFPIIKGTGTFPANGTLFHIEWIRSDGVVSGPPSKYMNMSEFQDSGVYAFNGYQQYVAGAMIYPVVCYASTARTVTVRLSRSTSGPQAFLGRPIALSGACSWFITQ